MFFSRTGWRVTQLGLLRTNPLCNVQLQLRKVMSLGVRRGLQTSVFESEPSWQRVWKTTPIKRIFGAGTIASIGLGISAFTKPKVLCEGPIPGVVSAKEKEPYRPISDNEYPPPPQSSLSYFELSFGAVAGICSGVFVKKGARAVAWFLGGIFVLLQYLGSKSLVKVDWANMSSRFENTFYTRDATGAKKAPSFLSLWRWLVDFLTADFQPRASFLAGFALGLRVG